MKATKRKYYKTKHSDTDEEIEDENDDSNYCIICLKDYKSSIEDW